MFVLFIVLPFYQIFSNIETVQIRLNRKTKMSGKTKIQEHSLPNISPARKRLFWIITCVISFLTIIVFEIALRLFHYGGNPDLFVSIPDESSKYYGINLDIAKRYFTTLPDAPTPRKDLFLKEKPENGYRIFILGESTAAGFPYGNNVTFPRILNRRLSDAFPDKYVEVVNTALTAINSYTQLDFMDEILQQKPDALLIYAGHNEYYGALGIGSMESIGKQRWVVKTVLALQKLRLYTLVQHIVSGIEDQLGTGSQNNHKSDPSATLMERIVANKSIPYKSEEYEAGKEQFRENLSEIIEKARHAGVRVILSELVSNIRDNEPFESIEGADTPSAMNLYTSAQKKEQQGNYGEAKTEYYFAKDLDALRFRAPEEFNAVIHEVASQYNVPVVPMKSLFELHSPHGIIGNNLMLEHLHPNLEGYFLMADAFFDTMQKEKFISDEWREENIKPAAYYRTHWGMTALDSVYASLIVTRLKGGWPFIKEQRQNIALDTIKLSTIIDTVAARIVSTGVETLEQGHMELADYYQRNGDFEKAFNEYNALIYTVPYFDLFYEPALKVLVGMKRYDKAIEILFDLLHYQKTAFTYQWIGQIYLLANQPLEGIPYLEKARERDAHNSVLLYNLCRAYYNLSEFEKGNEILKQLKKSSTDYALISKLEEYKKSSLVN